MENQSTLVDSASVLVIRDNQKTGGLEVLMGKRHQDINFAGGAYVFPGGKLDQNDLAVGFQNSSFPIGYNQVIGTAFREVFEESGIVIGSSEGAAAFRQELISQKIDLAEFIKKARVTFNVDDLVPFARWVTPKIYTKRFDTRFFLAKMPINQSATPDQQEIVDAVWVKPIDFIEKFKETMMYPTLMNLKLLGRSRSVEEAITHARNRKIVTVEPKIINGVRVVDPAAGYEEIDQNYIHQGVKKTD